MISNELFKTIRRIEIRTRGLVNNLFVGEYQSAFKGKGMLFSEVRPYQYGDDVRLIDWNVTARYNEPYIKLLEEEREQTLMLCVDISASGQFGSASQSKLDLAAELSALMAFSAITNNDLVGLMMFSDRVEQTIPPRKGRRHVLRLIRELYTRQAEGSGTSLSRALHYANSLLKRRSIVVVISDFQDRDFETQLKVTRNKHDLVCIPIEDSLENELPDLGVMPFRDAETGSLEMIDTSSEKVRQTYRQRRREHQHYLESLFARHRIDTIPLQTNRSYINALRAFFERRSGRQ